VICLTTEGNSFLSFTEDFDEVRDASTDRTFVLDKNVLHVRREDPYGFWLCKYEKGGVPEELKSAFTSFDEAEKAVRNYLNKANKEIKAVITK
jgi:hypothetical protein